MCSRVLAWCLWALGLAQGATAMVSRQTFCAETVRAKERGLEGVVGPVLHQLVEANPCADRARGRLSSLWQWSLSWSRLLPNATHVMWSESEVGCLMFLYYPDVWNAYRHLARAPERGVLGGLAIVHRLGGAYAARELELLSPWTTWPGPGVADSLMLPGPAVFWAALPGARTPYFVLQFLHSRLQDRGWLRSLRHESLELPDTALAEALAQLAGVRDPGPLANETHTWQVMGLPETVLVLDPAAWTNGTVARLHLDTWPSSWGVLCWWPSPPLWLWVGVALVLALACCSCGAELRRWQSGRRGYLLVRQRPAPRPAAWPLAHGRRRAATRGAARAPRGRPDSPPGAAEWQTEADVPCDDVDPATEDEDHPF